MDPLNKTEAYLDYLANDGTTFAELPEAMTRTEKYLYALCVKKNGDDTEDTVTQAYFDYLADDGTSFAELPEATTRTEQYLYALCVMKNAEEAEDTFTQGAAVADSVATDAAGIVTDFNALLAVLRTAGIIATETEVPEA